MLEFAGIVAICAACIWLARYLWSFWRFRQSINAVEALASAVRAKADFVAAKSGPNAAEKTYFIAICLRSLAHSLSYGQVANSLIVGTQLEVLEGMIESPDDLAFYMNDPGCSIKKMRLHLVRARESFILLCRTFARS